MKVWLCRNRPDNYYKSEWVSIYGEKPDLKKIVILAGEEKRIGTVLYTDLQKWFGIKLRRDRFTSMEMSLKAK